MSTPKQRVNLSGLASPVRLDPETVQALINEFFSYYGGSAEVENTLWAMFSGSISNSDMPTDSTQNGNQAFLYRMLLDLVRELEKFKENTITDLTQN
ncbi:hypothetical protein [Telluribacter sp.]|jgi:uncharacterized protein YpbB|uniref:hypothetical protein n=1 Tax=Telluribacter sp. TaxID=1978767 RepID=UPI002E0F1662|nr:hypothetical protein [Telluribacter sp.]